MNVFLAELYERFPELEPVPTPVYDQVVQECGVDPLAPARPTRDNPWAGLYAHRPMFKGQIRRIGMLEVAEAESVINKSLPRGQYFRVDRDALAKGDIRGGVHRIGALG